MSDLIENELPSLDFHNCIIAHTHGVILLPIPAIVYYINTLDIQLCRRGRGVPTILYVGEVFYKTINYN